jgi:signal transduction histidine kinase
MQQPSEFRRSPEPVAGKAFGRSFGFDPLAALEALPAAVAVIAPDWTLSYSNRAWMQLLGAHDQVGRLVWEALPSLAQGPASEVLRQTMADGIARSCRATLRNGRGEQVLDVALSRFGGGLLATLQDASATYEQTRAWERNEEIVSLHELARQMAADLDPGALLHTLCEAASQNTGADGAAVIELLGEGEGQLVAGCGVAEQRRGLRLPIDPRLRDRVVREQRTITLTDYATDYAQGASSMRGNEIGPVMLAPLVAHSQVLGVLAVARRWHGEPFAPPAERMLRVIADHAAVVLWKAKLSEEAEAASRAKSTFLATMSHELRTPIAALTGYGELLTDEIVGPLSAEQSEIVERMCSVTSHLSMVIEELLTYSSLEAGREKVRLAEFDAAEVLLAAQSVVEPLARQKGLAYEHSLPGGLLFITSDIDKVRQILINLAGNAVKFTDHGRVRVSVELVSGEIRFRVADSGIGIAQEDRTRLFQPFAQLDAGLTRRHGGTGLGLYISHHLARLIGARIEVESSPGKGSVFTLVVPETPTN